MRYVATFFFDRDRSPRFAANVAIDYKELSRKASGEPSEAIRARVENARRIQAERYGATSSGTTNSTMPPKLVSEHCQLDGLLEQAMNELNLSARAHDRILKVSRILTDLEGAADIQANHVLEAIQNRTLDRNLWG